MNFSPEFVRYSVFPAFLRGLYRASMRFVLIEADRAREASDTVAPLPSLEVVLNLASFVASPVPRGGNIPKCRLLPVVL